MQLQHKNGLVSDINDYQITVNENVAKLINQGEIVEIRWLIRAVVPKLDPHGHWISSKTFRGSNLCTAAGLYCEKYLYKTEETKTYLIKLQAVYYVSWVKYSTTTDNFTNFF